MSALRFGAGIGAGVALAALVSGAASLGAPAAAEPEPATVTAPAPSRAAEAKKETAPPPRTASPRRKADVERGVLARAAASRQPKGGEGAAPPKDGAQRDPAGRAAGEGVIQSVEVDWGAPHATP